MIIDASIVVALVAREPTAAWILDTLNRRHAEPLRMSWVNIAEAGMAIRKTSPLAAQVLEAALKKTGIEPLELDQAVVDAAVEARGRFPLNFGDCFAYAHAKVRNEALLTLDADFLKTDLADVVHPDRDS